MRAQKNAAISGRPFLRPHNFQVPPGQSETKKGSLRNAGTPHTSPPQKRPVACGRRTTILLLFFCYHFLFMDYEPKGAKDHRRCRHCTHNHFSAASPVFRALLAADSFGAAPPKSISDSFLTLRPSIQPAPQGQANRPCHHQDQVQYPPKARLELATIARPEPRSP